MTPLAVAWLGILVMNISTLVASYVATSTEGLEVRLWPFYFVRLRWEDVNIPNDVPHWASSYGKISLDKADEIEEAKPALMFQRFFRPFGGLGRHNFSPNAIRGYPRGEFADQLRHYAPHLFDDADTSDSAT